VTTYRDPGTIFSLLANARVIAVVGLSPRPDRPSNEVARYLRRAGYRIVPVNPEFDEVLGEQSYPDIQSIPFKVDLVDVFRRPHLVMPVVEDAIAAGVPAIWFQDGIINEVAAEAARAAGLQVVMDNCTLREHRRLAAAGRLVRVKD
jgi:predicted CoA-binding protein